MNLKQWNDSFIFSFLCPWGETNDHLTSVILIHFNYFQTVLWLLYLVYFWLSEQTNVVSDLLADWVFRTHFSGPICPLEIFNLQVSVSFSLVCLLDLILLPSHFLWGTWTAFCTHSLWCSIFFLLGNSVLILHQQNNAHNEGNHMIDSSAVNDMSYVKR
jgi:hypothetical protein